MPSSRRHRLLASAVAAMTLALALGACSTSAPAVVAPTDTATALVGPSPSPGETLLEPSEDSHSKVGGIVDGFPTDLVPVPAGATVLVSSAAPVEGTELLQIGLNLRSTDDAKKLLAEVRAPLVAAGFTEGAPQSEPGLAAQASFSRHAGEILTAGVLDRDGVRTLTLGGTVDANP
ncbi:hypothetical protein [Cellulomonas alba]|uniref:Uncharacterized protein n=1 Tax=Cellulomonas alba TaxID=3053467 RepID=A0ABT7SDI9_9CELL|nr:hypothetical protein [Cellulomonas alba]MDM7853589.1 hypothetical protein [Cellulomonas alba]